MKYEFVEFYPKPPELKNKKAIGTVHIFVIDMNIDIRGIVVQKHGKNLIFKMPFLPSFDNGKKVFFPAINFIDIKDKKQWIAFMQKEVSPIIKKRLGLS